MLVLFDFPTGLTAESAARLKSIVENGPRCGVFTLIAADVQRAGCPMASTWTQLAASTRRLNLQGAFVATR